MNLEIHKPELVQRVNAHIHGLIRKAAGHKPRPHGEP